MGSSKRWQSAVVGLVASVAWLMTPLAFAQTNAAPGAQMQMQAPDQGGNLAALPVQPVVYVSDFELDAADVQPDQGPGSRARRILGSVLPAGPLRKQNDQDPQAHAQAIVAGIAHALTADLVKAGIDARRAAPDNPLPDVGWLVRGVFLDVDQGNRVRRAVVGFGAGNSGIQVAVAIDDLSKPGQPPLYQAVDEGSGGGHMPGAIVKLNPYVVAAKFVMTGRDENKAINDTAERIAETIVARIHATAPK